jgi:hypothetical protein
MLKKIENKRGSLLAVWSTWIPKCVIPCLAYLTGVAVHLLQIRIVIRKLVELLIYCEVSDIVLRRHSLYNRYIEIKFKIKQLVTNKFCTLSRVYICISYDEPLKDWKFDLIIIVGNQT